MANGYVKPEVVSHRAITFETAVSGGIFPGQGHGVGGNPSNGHGTFPGGGTFPGNGNNGNNGNGKGNNGNGNGNGNGKGKGNGKR
jgi:hypothetical protein